MRTFSALLSLSLLASCVTTATLPPEARGRFILNADAEIYPCQEFTSTFSAVVGGMNEVSCLVAARKGRDNDPEKLLPRGTPVRIIEIRTQRLVDSYSQLALLSIGDGQHAREVYADWPRYKVLLTPSQ